MTRGNPSSDRLVSDLASPPSALPPGASEPAEHVSPKALEKVGKMLARNGGNRGRARVGATTPFHLMHTVIQPTPRDIDKGLHGAWDVIPAMLDHHGCCGVTSRQVEQMVDSYSRDLLVTGKAHNMDDLRYRFERFLGVPLPVPEVAYEPPRKEA